MSDAFEPPKKKKSGCVTDGHRLLGPVVLLSGISKVIVENNEDETIAKQAKNYV